jgi:hypothetical protein
MIFLRLLPVLISFLLMAAHFVRAGQTLYTVVLLSMLLLLMLRKAWVPRVITVVLLLAAAEWLYTLVSVAQMRISFGMPWMRMAIILGAVALLTALSSLVFRSAPLRKRFSDAGQSETR